MARFQINSLLIGNNSLRRFAAIMEYEAQIGMCDRVFRGKSDDLLKEVFRPGRIAGLIGAAGCVVQFRNAGREVIC